MATLTPTATVQPLPAGIERWRRDHDGAAIGSPYTQGALALTYTLRTGVDMPPPLPHVRPDAGADLHAWATRFVQAVVEVVSSDRPLTQLARWTSTPVYEDLARRRELVLRHRQAHGVRPGRQQVASVHVSRPDAAAAEVAARVCAGRRSRAIAARLEYRRERWVCTTIAFG